MQEVRDLEQRDDADDDRAVSPRAAAVAAPQRIGDQRREDAEGDEHGAGVGVHGAPGDARR